MLPLVVGTLLAVVAVAYVLYPLLFSSASATSRPIGLPRVAPVADEDAIVALREIEFDRVTGKLSDTDYAELKSRYTNEAVRAMRREDAPSAGAGERPTDDELEAAVLAYRRQSHVCQTCGPRPEPDAVYCSNCGRYLHDRCADCGAPVVALDARYCLNCGNRLAA